MTRQLLAEEVRTYQINSVLPRFNPGKQIKRTLNTIEFSNAFPEMQRDCPSTVVSLSF